MNMKGAPLLKFDDGNIPKCLASAGIDPLHFLEKSPLDLWEIFIEFPNLGYGAGQCIKSEISGPLSPKEGND
jgi:hypothetical protein